MKQFFVVSFNPGPNWLEGKSVFEQPLDDHLIHLHSLYRQGHVLMGGPLSDGSGGLTIIQAQDEDEARRLIDSDPDVKAGILTPALQRWSPIDWAQGMEPNVQYAAPPLRISHA